MSLMAFATQKKPGHCFVCRLAERSEIEDAWERGIRAKAIIDWLRTKGQDTTTDRSIRSHFDRDHHKEVA